METVDDPDKVILEGHMSILQSKYNFLEKKYDDIKAKEYVKIYW